MKHLLILVSIIICFLSSFSQNALNFDGTDDEVNCGAPAALNVGGKSFSLEAWVKANSWNTNIFEGSIVIKENNSNNGGFMLRAGNGGKINFGIGAGTNGAWTELTTSALLSTNTWYHIAATYDGKKMRIYQDGIIKDSLSASVTVGGTASTALVIGSHPTYTGRAWNGYIDEVRIWDTTLTASQISAHRNSEFCSLNIPHLKGYYKLDEGSANSNNLGVTSTADYSGNGNTGTLKNFALIGSSSNWSNGASISQDTVMHRDTFTHCDPYWDSQLGQFIYNSTVVSRHIPTAAGCDSFTTKTIIIKESSNIVLDKWVCDSIVSATGKIYNKSGTYYDFLTNSVGCDSVVTLNLTVGADSTIIDTIVCNQYISSSNIVYDTSGTYYEVFNSHIGCDSIVELRLTVNKPTSSTVDLYACDSIQSPSLTKWLAPSDIYQDTITNHLGCDSFVMVTVHSLQTFSNISISNCYEYTSPSGKKWTLSGTYLDTIANSYGCDSIIQIQLTIHQSTDSTLYIEGCKQVVLPRSSKTVFVSGEYKDTLVNTAGCDSIITYSVTINTVNIQVKAEPQALIALSSSGTFQWLDCNNSMSRIADATNATYQHDIHGKFAVEVSDNNCVDTSECYRVGGVWVNDNKSVNQLQIVPNPAHGSFRIATNINFNKAHLSIQNCIGQQVYEIQQFNSQSIRTTDLSPGIYFVKVYQGEQVYLGKVIVRE